MITEFVDRVLNFNQEKYKENLDEEHFSNFIKIDLIVEYKRGGCYVKDKAFEDRVREALVLVKNTTDDNCLYSALFIGLVLSGR